MIHARASFRSEKALITTVMASPDFPSVLGFQSWAFWQASEVEGLFGIPDLVIAFTKMDQAGRTIIRTCAIEFKRSHWRKALTQAFRYASFAHYSLVCLDDAFSGPAMRSLDLFKTANIGLLTVDTDGTIVWRFKPKFRLPYSQPLTSELRARVRSTMQMGPPCPSRQGLAIAAS